MRWRLGVAVAVLAACGDSSVDIPATCNGSEALCARTYDDVSYATSHNAMSSEENAWVNPNQFRNIEHQLEDGVRALMLDVHEFEGEPYLCHSICQLGSERLVNALARIREFLDANRGEVLTFILETYVPATEFATAMQDSGLLPHAFAHSGGAWPTLRQLIDSDTRLVVLSDENDAMYDWYHYVWDHAWETHFSARELTDFSCDRNRGTDGNALFIFNHFLTQTTPVPEDAAVVNANPLLIDRANECRTASGSLPNFVTVDFTSVGDLFTAVDALNGL